MWICAHIPIQNADFYLGTAHKATSTNSWTHCISVPIFSLQQPAISKQAFILPSFSQSYAQVQRACRNTRIHEQHKCTYLQIPCGSQHNTDMHAFVHTHTEYSLCGTMKEWTTLVTVVGDLILTMRREKQASPAHIWLRNKVHNSSWLLKCLQSWRAMIPIQMTNCSRGPAGYRKRRLRKERIYIKLNYFNWENKPLSQLEANACPMPSQRLHSVRDGYHPPEMPVRKARLSLICSLQAPLPMRQSTFCRAKERERMEKKRGWAPPPVKIKLTPCIQDSQVLSPLSAN